MTGFSDYTAKAALNWLAGFQAMPALAPRYLALFTAVGTDAGTGFVEVSGGAYARVQIAGSAATNGTTSTSSATLSFAATPAWVVPGMEVFDSTTTGAITGGQTVNTTTGTTAVMSANANATVGNGDSIWFSAFGAPSGSAPSQITNGAATITFPQATANWGTVIAFGLYDALTSGNLLAWDYLGNYAWLPAYITSASPGVFDVKAPGFSAADTIVFTNEYGGTAPSFSQSNLSGLLAVVGPSGDTFTVTNGGTAVNTSSTGDGMVRKVLQQSIPINTTASFSTSTLTVTSA